MMRVAFFVFFSLAVMADNGTIELRSKEVKLICPKIPSEWGTQSERIKNSTHKKDYSFIYEEDRKGVIYYCMYENEKYSFYFKGKDCDNCYELDGKTLLTLISGDLLVTGVVILFAYHQAQRKLGPAPAAAANHQSPSREPESNYEDLSPRTRDNATYAGVHRTG